MTDEHENGRGEEPADEPARDDCRATASLGDAVEPRIKQAEKVLAYLETVVYPNLEQVPENWLWDDSELAREAMILLLMDQRFLCDYLGCDWSEVLERVEALRESELAEI